MSDYTVPCDVDAKCYRNAGHAGPHAYPDGPALDTVAELERALMLVETAKGPLAGTDFHAGYRAALAAVRDEIVLARAADPLEGRIEAHEHRWVRDARNTVVEPREVCPDCGATRAADPLEGRTDG